MDLTRHLFAHSTRGMLGSLALCVLMAYGISSLLYFSNEFFYVTENRDGLWYVVSVVASNIVDALTALVVCQGVIRVRGKLLVARWPQYAAVAILTLGLALGLEEGLREILRQATKGRGLFSIQESSFFLRLAPAAVAVLYYHLWERYAHMGEKISEQAYQLLQLEKLRTKAELDALQARVNPHFLFNALNSIASLILLDPVRAEEMTLLLAKLFRYTTDVANTPLNSVQDELDIVRTYLAIEQVRFQERLSYSVHVEHGLERLLIPRFLLQPLVENAVKHGISQLVGSGLIHISISTRASEVVLVVEDNGPEFPDDFLPGYGLQSINDKLRLLYGTQAALSVQMQHTKQVEITFARHLLGLTNTAYANASDR